jgi:hypothetical protein
MSMKVRLVVALALAQLAFVAIFAWGGWTSGIYIRSSQAVYLGWSGAWRVGLMATALLSLPWLVIGLAAWVKRGRR